MTTETKIKERLSRDAVEALAKRMPEAWVSNETSDLQAGFQLGVQHVLNFLRKEATP